ncbi:Hint domain-containing protein [Pseudaestuariivita atlantica]|uniref:Hedgehog/Intein (Hint) domain-containing protein n=1 Tax=Pseudaestuariivita atlantica TaxID=1317121 RepID=A0A0L1JUP5_9RHOB|nr:Hint domain-containing protein [Pseudaestuariivita atlantica]KNG95422.1 hypothetical protein ATO11_02115 [Pseudaestuariivita atlantica]
MSNDVSRLAAEVACLGADAVNVNETGLVEGSLVLTRDGELPVEYVGLSDHLITRDAGYVPVSAVYAERRDMRMVRIAPGSLGHTRPEVEMLLPWSQLVLVRDWRASALYNTRTAMVPAYRLIDGEFVTDAGVRDVTIYRLSCDAPHVMYAGGLELATGVRQAAIAA